MEKTYKFLPIIGASATVLMIAGCSTTIEKVTAEYVMPPAAIKNIKAIDTIDIVPSITLSGNAVKGNDKTYANGALVQRIAARLCQEGFYRTTDIAWGSTDGVDNLADAIDKKNSVHGRARYATETNFKRAKLSVTLNAKINSKHEKKNVQYTLEDIPYIEKKVGKMPVGIPDLSRAKITKVMRQIDVFSITGSGDLIVKLTDKNGKLVYEKNFSNLSYRFETSNNNHNALPLNAAVIAKMIVPAIETVVADISPHKEQRELVVNEDGDKKAVLLLKAQAFQDARARLDKVLKDDKKAADYENRGIIYEITGDYHSAGDDFQSAKNIAPNSPIALAGLDRIKKILDKDIILSKAKKLQKATGTAYKTGNLNEEIKK